MLGTIYGVVIGVLLSFVDVIRRASQPSRELLGVISGQPGFYPLGRMSQAHPLEGVALYRFSGGLFFANIDRFQKDVENCVKPGIRAVIVDASGIVSVDLTSAERLVLLYRRLKEQGVRLYLTEHIGQVNDELRRFGAGELIEEGAVRRTLYAALEDCGAAEGEVKQWIPEEMRHAVPELLRQTQELEWAYGEEAQSKLDAMTGQVLQTLGGGRSRSSGEQELGVPAGAGPVAGGVIDRDAILQHLEEHLAELSRLLERSEDAVAAGAGAGAGTGDGGAAAVNTRRSLRIWRPHREELEQRFQRKYPEAARHIHELRQRLHQPPEEETQEAEVTDMACYIFGAGDFDGLEERPGAEDYVIAADGGYTACRRAGVEPQLLLGDFDSLAEVPALPHVERGAGGEGRYGHDAGRQAGVGARRDTVPSLRRHGRTADGSHRGQFSGAFVSGGSRCQRLAPRTGRAMDRHPGTAASCFRPVRRAFCRFSAWGPDAEGVTIRGAQYPLGGGDLDGLGAAGCKQSLYWARYYGRGDTRQFAAGVT